MAICCCMKAGFAAGGSMCVGVADRIMGAAAAISGPPAIMPMGERAGKG